MLISHSIPCHKDQTSPIHNELSETPTATPMFIKMSRQKLSIQSMEKENMACRILSKRICVRRKRKKQGDINLCSVSSLKINHIRDLSYKFYLFYHRYLAIVKIHYCRQTSNCLTAYYSNKSQVKGNSIFENWNTYQEGKKDQKSNTLDKQASCTCSKHHQVDKVKNFQQV